MNYLIFSIVESFARSRRSSDCGNGFKPVSPIERLLGIPNDAALR